MHGFMEFIKKQGVLGLTVGFLLGGSVAKVVSSLVNDILNPLLGIVLGSTKNLTSQYFNIGTAKIMWGNFVSNFIDFLIIALVMYLLVKLLKLDKMKLRK